MGGDKRHKELAAQCSVTLVAEAYWELHSRSNPELVKALRANGLNNPEARYDLLALPSFHGLAGDRQRMGMLVGNIALAIDVHSAEKVFLLHRSSDDANEFYTRLKREMALRFPKVALNPIFVSKLEEHREPSRRLVLTCMDFRLHHETGLQGMFTEASAWLTYPGAAFAGLDAKTEEVFFSDLGQVLDREAVGELTIVSHTDCAKYAGKFPWKNSREERRQLGNDLRVVAGRIRSVYSHLTVLCAIARVQDGVVKELIPVT